MHSNRLLIKFICFCILGSKVLGVEHAPIQKSRPASSPKIGYQFYFVLEDMEPYLDAAGEPLYFPKLNTSIENSTHALLLSQFLLEKGTYKPTEYEKKLLNKSLNSQKYKGIILYHPLTHQALCYMGNIQTNGKDLFPGLPECSTVEDLLKAGSEIPPQKINHKTSIEERQRMGAKTYTPQVQEKFKNRISIAAYAPDKPKKDLNCPRAMVDHWKSAEAGGIKDVVNSLNFNPKDCVWDTIDMHSKSNGWGKIKPLGYTFGTTFEISAGAGYTTGVELVVMKVPGREALMVGVVGYRGFDLSIGMPGGSFVQGVIYGNCDDAIYSYLGWFLTMGGGAISKSYGKDNLLNWNDTGCNSTTSTRGTTTSLLNYSRTYYVQSGEFAVVTGPRIKPFLDNLRARNPELP